MDIYKRLTRQITTYLSIFLLTTQPLLAEVIVDASAPESNQAGVTQTDQGVPLVNISAPSSSGLSHNKFEEYSVDQNNLILNNSLQSVDTLISGQISANPNLTSHTATLILNEVTGSNQSSLAGYTEIGGDQAELIIANPNGITCSGCGFINTPRATLTTGTPQFIGNELQSFSVNGGNISISGEGLNAGNLDQLDLIGRSLQIDAPLLARELNLIAGLNDVSYEDLIVTIRENSKDGTPQISIDSSNLGGMYANVIHLVATERGVGVTLDGSMATDTGSVTLSADGSIALTKVVANQDVQVASTGGDISVSDLVYGQNVDISADGTASNTGTVSALNSVGIKSNKLNNSSYIVAGLNADGSLNAGQSLAIESDEINNSGSILSTKDINLAVSDLSNQEGTVEAIAGNLAIDLENSISNESGKIIAGNNIELTTDKYTATKDHGFNAGNDWVLNAGEFENSEEFKMDSNLVLNLDNKFSNEGDISATGNINVTADEIKNEGTGKLASTGLVNLQAQKNVENLGIISATSGLAIQANDILNKGSIVSGDTLTLTASQSIVNSNINENGQPISLTSSLENDDVLTASGGEKGTLLFSVGDMAIYSDSFLNQYADVYTFGDLNIAKDNSNAFSTSVLNSSSRLEASGDINISASTFKNYRDPITDFDYSEYEDFMCETHDTTDDFCFRTHLHYDINGIPWSVPLITGGEEYGIPNGTDIAEAWLYDSVLDLYFSEDFDQEDYRIAQEALEKFYLAALYTPEVRAGENITINGNAVTNRAGVLSAGNNISVNAVDFTNEAIAVASPDILNAPGISLYAGPNFNKDTLYIYHENDLWTELVLSFHGIGYFASVEYALADRTDENYILLNMGGDIPIFVFSDGLLLAKENLIDLFIKMVLIDFI